MTLKINFFGASVTQQKEGYASIFKKNNPGIECSIFGYGGNHISGAGICYLDEILMNKPEFLILDWFSTGYCKESNLEKVKIFIDTILYKTIKAGVRPVLLFLPQKKTPRVLYEYLKQYINNFNVPVIDIDLKLNGRDDILRDTVHTNQLGSHLYADELTKSLYLIANENRNSFIIPDRNKYCEIKKIKIYKKIHSNLTLEGNAEIIGIDQTVGPYTGYVRIGNYLENLWDRWCYFERNMFHMNFNIEGMKLIEVLQDDFDRSAAEIQFNWPNEKLLNLSTLYYSGDFVKILDQN